MSDVWWCILVKPNGARHLYELGPEPYDVELAKVRTAHSVPDDWAERTDGWSLSVAPGEPHPTQIWSNAELNQARQQLETAAGIPGQRDKLDALEDALTAARASMPPAAWEDFRDSVRKARRVLRQISLAEIRTALINAGVAPSKAIVHRLPTP